MDRVEEQVKLLKKAVVDLLLSHLELQQQRLTLRLGGCVFGILRSWVVVKKGFVECNVFVCNVLTMMYFKSGVLRDARKVFDDMCHIGVEDVVSWNSIVAVVEEREGGSRVCASEWAFSGCVCKVDMNAKCELMDDVSKVTERIKVTDVVFWNAMVTGYFQVRRFEDALSMFEMIKSGEEV
ncbi:pentatricopeptide repeat-containing protein At5g16860-like [Apium graveolens]|uniref:pentatricopeptide repeat-containing protein At5g16860-like n=1 Tax=Apium graveolens TaxID=4045 RepID=UPI003D7A96A6